MAAITTGHTVARFKLGDWSVEPRTNRLERAHRRCTIEPRQMAVLLALAQAPDRLLTKSQLLDAVWPHRFVVDGVLKRAVSQLRRALGDDARAPRYIQTVYKVGYRLLPAPRPCNTGHTQKISVAPYNMTEVCRCLAFDALCASAPSEMAAHGVKFGRV